MLTVELVATGCEPAQALRLNQCLMPEPGHSEVRVKVLARPINPADLLLIEGRHVYSPDLPSPIGIEGAGFIDAVGPGTTLKPGTLVAIPAGGTWRDYLIATEDLLIPLAADFGVEQAATLSVNPFTAAGLLRGLQSGDSVVINAANSSIARMILALGRQRGLHLIALVRSLDHRQAILDLGADAVLLDGPDLNKDWAMSKLPPVRRALDAVAGEASARLFDLVAEGGELVVYGLLSSDLVQLPAAQLVFRDVLVKGFSRLRSLKALTMQERTAMAEELTALVQKGVLASNIEARYPLSDVVAALEHQSRPERRGKILLISD